MIEKPTVPWGDAAVLIRSGQMEFGREIVAEGSLMDVVALIATYRSGAKASLSIAFPDRHVAPLGYGPESFAALVTELQRPSRRATPRV